jgi:hypothetical protein
MRPLTCARWPTNADIFFDSINLFCPPWFFLTYLSRSSLLANIVHIDYIETVLKVVVCGVSMATTFVSSDGRAVSISPISDEVKRLKVISCDLCETGMAAYDVFIDGMITKVNVLKRCCDQCVKSFSQQLP